MAWVRHPILWACRARLIQAAPVSKACTGRGLASVPPGAVATVAEITAIRAEARWAQARLVGARVWQMVSKSALPARP